MVVIQSVVVVALVLAVLAVVVAADDVIAALAVDHTYSFADAAAVEDVAFVVAPSFDQHSLDLVVPAADSVACSNEQTIVDGVAVRRAF